jgi:DNA-binding NarL/FixJ family response regulator
MQKIRVLLADDHTLVRQGLRALLALELDVEVVGEADNGRKAVEMAKKLQPDVALIDIGMPVLNGLEATRQIKRAASSTKVLILSLHSDALYVERSLQAGAAGYLVKHGAFDELLEAIHAVQKGATFFSPSIARRFGGARRNGSTGTATKARDKHLSGRETEVLQLIAEGRANKQIADELGISIKTVEKHRQQVMNKLGIHTIAGLTRHALANGVLENDVDLSGSDIIGS